MVQTPQRPAVTWTEKFVDADGFHIRYVEAGEGKPVISFHGGAGLRTTPVDNLLTQQFRVIQFELPGFGQSAENTRTKSMHDFATTIAQAATAIGLDSYSLVSVAVSARIAIWMAIDNPEKTEALVLLSPSAILPDDWRNPAGGHGAAPAEPRDPAAEAIAAKQRALVARVRGPNREPEMEAKLWELPVATLVLFGTRDEVIPPEMGRIYREKMPNCNLVYVYDSGHSIHADRPEAAYAAVGDFIERHETFIVSRANTMINP